MKNNMCFPRLYSKSREIRLAILNTVYNCGKGHIGGAFSCVDILVALYCGKVMNYIASNPKWEDRDRFILSKGHAAIALYAVLADVGYFDKSELDKMNRGGMLGEHPDINIPGIEINSGSLGHGLGIGAGMAYAARLDNKKSRTFVLMGDGECYEGSVWEAAMFASHHNLSNLVAIVDRNGLCIHGPTEDINKLESLEDKFNAFGWAVFSVNGHEIEEIVRVLEPGKTNNPVMIIANTVKGKGVSFMENNASWHHGGLNEKQYEQAQADLINN